MAKMTKLQKQAAQEQFASDAADAARASYMPRLMAALAEVTSNSPAFNFELTVTTEYFVVTDRNTKENWKMPPSWNMNEWELESLERELVGQAAAFDKVFVKAQKKAALLAKLTKEELELLGL
jgi:hypothetical protein